MTTPLAHPLKLDRIGQIAIPVNDVSRATAFYRDTLGMTYLFSAPPGLAFFDCGGVRLMLSRPEEGEATTASSLYYRVDDIHAAHATLVERGVEFVHPPHRIAQLADRDVWMAFFRDSEDNLLAITSEPLRDVAVPAQAAVE